MHAREEVLGELISLLLLRERRVFARRWSAKTFLMRAFNPCSACPSACDLDSNYFFIVFPAQVPVCYRAAEEPRLEACNTHSRCLKKASAVFILMR